MRNLTDFALRLEYERAKDLGDKLVDIGGRLNWEGFRPPPEFCGHGRSLLLLRHPP